MIGKVLSCEYDSSSNEVMLYVNTPLSVSRLFVTNDEGTITREVDQPEGGRIIKYTFKYRPSIRLLYLEGISDILYDTDKVVVIGEFMRITSDTPRTMLRLLTTLKMMDKFKDISVNSDETRIIEATDIDIWETVVMNNIGYREGKIGQFVGNMFCDISIAGDIPDVYCSFDIESIGEGLEFPNAKRDGDVLTCISYIIYSGCEEITKDVLYWGLPQGEVGRPMKNEYETLEEFMRILILQGVTHLVGFNIKRFDIPYVVERCRIHKIDTDRFGTLVKIDLYDPYKRISLKRTVMEKLPGTMVNKMDLQLSWSEVFTAFQAIRRGIELTEEVVDRMKMIPEYCLRDSEICRALHQE